MKILEVIKKASEELEKLNIEESNLKIKILLSYLLNVKKEYLILNGNDELKEDIEKIFFEKLELIKNNYPIQYIVNKQSFYGYDFFVNENVLIPQPDTEILVFEVIEYIKNLIEEKRKENKLNEKIKVLDLCTGSGIIAICTALNFKDYVTVYASDISSEALEVAKINSENLKTEIEFVKSDLFENIKNVKFDIIVSNPPYIKTNVIESLDKEVQNEPFIALDGKEDGLYFYKRIIKECKDYLSIDGKVFFEIGYDQKEEVKKLFENNGFIEIYSKKDFGNNDRIVVAKKGE